MESADEKSLAEIIKKRLGTHVMCAVFENQLSVVWPRAYENDSRIKEIEAFAKSNGWSVTISDPGIRLTFKKLRTAEPKQFWVRSKWRAEELDKQHVQFELLLESGEFALGIGKFHVTTRPEIDDLLWIQVVVIEQQEDAPKARQTRLQISQMSADKIELHPNQDIARFVLC